MGAYKNFCIGAAEAGMCPLSPDAWGYLDDMECARQIDWIEYCEFDYEGRGGVMVVQECITVGSARRLVAEGLANDEIADFVEHFGWLAPASDDVDQCSDCGKLMPPGRRQNRHGERWCEDCA